MSSQLDSTFARDDFVWLLGSMCNIHRLPFDAKLLLGQYSPPYRFDTLIAAALALGIEAKLSAESDDPALEKFPTPFIAFRKAGLPADVPRSINAEIEIPQDTSVAMVVKVATGKVLYFPSGSQTALTVTTAEFLAQHEARCVLFHPLVPVVDDKDAPKGEQAFGFRWFIPALLKHKKIWHEIILASLFIQLIALAVPLCTQAIIDKVVVHQTMGTLYVIAAALLVFMLFSAALTWLRQYLVVHTGNRVDAVLGAAVFERLVKLPVRYFEYRPTGVVAARLHGVETIREFVSGAAVSLMLDLPFLVIFLAIMFYYNVLLTVITMVIVLLIAVMSLLLAPVFQLRLNKQFLLGARNQAFLTEYVAGIETVKSLQMEPTLISKYSDYLASYLDAGFHTRQLANHYNTLANVLEQLMTTAILCVGAWQVMQHPDFTIGMLVAFQMFAGRVSQPILRLVGLWQQFQQAQIAVRRLGDIMNAPAEPYSVVPQTQSTSAGEIEFREVSFRYGEALPFLYQNLNIKIASGECIAIMGPSGCGKSTLAKMMQGFYLPTTGQILIDGKDHRFLAANELRTYFGVVPQETVLFSGTIYDNLVLANSHATFDLIVEACKLAEIHDYIEQLPNGYQTEIGERGVGLSGGQKQRLAIARAMLKRPRILIFDEATSNLDQSTAEQFAKTINGLHGQVTMLFITHQLPSTLHVDRVINLGI